MLKVPSNYLVLDKQQLLIQQKICRRYNPNSVIGHAHTLKSSICFTHSRLTSDLAFSVLFYFVESCLYLVLNFKYSQYQNCKIADSGVIASEQSLFSLSSGNEIRTMFFSFSLSTKPNDHSRLEVTKRGCCRGTKVAELRGKHHFLNGCPTRRNAAAHSPGINRPIGGWQGQKVCSIMI